MFLARHRYPETFGRQLVNILFAFAQFAKELSKCLLEGSAFTATSVFLHHSRHSSFEQMADKTCASFRGPLCHARIHTMGFDTASWDWLSVYVEKYYGQHINFA